MTELDTGEHTVQKTNGWKLPRGGDPFNHELIGYNWEGREFRVPLVNEVLPNLWHGGYAENVDFGDTFDLIVSLYPWGRYGTNKERQEFKLYDSDTVDEQTVYEATEAVLAARREGKKVLVHCQAGLNRSSLVVANVLIREGMEPLEAVVHLRQARSLEVLFNKEFARWLLTRKSSSPNL